MAPLDVISYKKARKALKQSSAEVVWGVVKDRLASEGAPNRLYDPDLDGALGTVAVEALKVPSGEKIFFGTDNRYSLRFDPSMAAFVIRDEVKGEDILVIKA